LPKFVEKLENMFTTGQLIFAGFFIVVFVIAMIYAYGKDKALHNKFYKGNYKILLGFFGFILLLFLIKIFLKH
jgi:threonine/homoserine/homoserine lactone efflux protein